MNNYWTLSKLWICGLPPTISTGFDSCYYSCYNKSISSLNVCSNTYCRSVFMSYSLGILRYRRVETLSGSFKSCAIYASMTISSFIVSSRSRELISSYALCLWIIFGILEAWLWTWMSWTFSFTFSNPASFLRSRFGALRAAEPPLTSRRFEDPFRWTFAVESRMSRFIVCLRVWLPSWLKVPPYWKLPPPDKPDVFFFDIRLLFTYRESESMLWCCKTLASLEPAWLYLSDPKFLFWLFWSF